MHCSHKHLYIVCLKQTERGKEINRHRRLDQAQSVNGALFAVCQRYSRVCVRSQIFSTTGGTLERKFQCPPISSGLFLTQLKRWREKSKCAQNYSLWAHYENYKSPAVQIWIKSLWMKRPERGVFLYFSYCLVLFLLWLVLEISLVISCITYTEHTITMPHG